LFDPTTRRIIVGDVEFQLVGEGEPTEADFEQAISEAEAQEPQPASRGSFVEEFGGGFRDTVVGLKDLVFGGPGEETIETPLGPMSRRRPAQRIAEALSQGSERQFTKMFEGRDAAAKRLNRGARESIRLLEAYLADRGVDPKSQEAQQVILRASMGQPTPAIPKEVLDSINAEADRVAGPPSLEEQQAGARGVAGFLPGVGSFAADVGETLGEGNVGRAAGLLTAGAAIPKGGKAVKATVAGLKRLRRLLRRQPSLASLARTPSSGAGAPIPGPGPAALPLGEELEFPAPPARPVPPGSAPPTVSHPTLGPVEIISIDQAAGTAVVRPRSATTTTTAAEATPAAPAAPAREPTLRERMESLPESAIPEPFRESTLAAKAREAERLAKRRRPFEKDIAAAEEAHPSETLGQRLAREQGLPPPRVREREPSPVSPTVESGGTGALSAEELSRVAGRGERSYLVSPSGELQLLPGRDPGARALRRGYGVVTVDPSRGPVVTNAATGTADSAVMGAFMRAARKEPSILGEGRAAKSTATAKGRKPLIDKETVEKAVEAAVVNRLVPGWSLPRSFVRRLLFGLAERTKKRLRE
jgi:hypothetical protein